MKPRGIALPIFGVLMLFVSNGFAAQRPSLSELLLKIQELEDLVRQSYATSPLRPEESSSIIYEDPWDNSIILPIFNVPKRGARSSNSNSNTNINSRHSSRWSSRSPDDDSEFDSLGVRDRYTKRRRPGVTKIRGRHSSKRLIRPQRTHRHNYHPVDAMTHPSVGHYSSNQNLLSVRTVQRPYGSRSLGGSSNSNSNVNENINVNENSENSNGHRNVNEIDSEELDY